MRSDGYRRTLSHTSQKDSVDTRVHLLQDGKLLKDFEQTSFMITLRQHHWLFCSEYFMGGKFGRREVGFRKLCDRLREKQWLFGPVGQHKGMRSDPFCIYIFKVGQTLGLKEKEKHGIPRSGI